MKLIFSTVRKSKTCKSTIKYRFEAHTHRAQAHNSTNEPTLQCRGRAELFFVRVCFMLCRRVSTCVYVTKRSPRTTIKPHTPYYQASEAAAGASDCCHFCDLCKLNGWERCTRSVPECRPRNAYRSFSPFRFTYTCNAVPPLLKEMSKKQKNKRRHHRPSSERCTQKKKTPKETDPVGWLAAAAAVCTRNNLPSGINMRKFIFILAGGDWVLQAKTFQVCDFHYADCNMHVPCSPESTSSIDGRETMMRNLSSPAFCLLSLPQIKILLYNIGFASMIIITSNAFQ